MHACSLGLFLVTTALQPLASGCTKYVMGHPMPENMAKIVYKIVQCVSHVFNGKMLFLRLHLVGLSPCYYWRSVTF